jgi:dTDP-4-amino-4,6-dideoxygalactose transaminase
MSHGDDISDSSNSAIAANSPPVGELEFQFLQPVLESGRWGGDSIGGLACMDTATPAATVAEGLGVEQSYVAAEFAALQSLQHAVPVANGTRALVVALLAACSLAEEEGKRALRPGGKVVVAGLTWQATALAPLERRLAPVLMDVNPASGVVDAEAVAAALRDDRDGEVVAVVLPHLYCRMADMPEIVRVCDDYGVISIEDCAHAHGGRIAGRPAGGIADFGTWSFQGSKSVTCGEGGMVTTKHERIVDQLVSIATCGRPIGRSEPVQAGNDRLGALQAAVLRAQLRRFYWDQLPIKQRVLGEFEHRLNQVEGVSAMAPQLADTQITYKALVRIQPSAFGVDSVDELVEPYQRLLGYEVGTVYEPLNDNALYQPLTDPAHRWSTAFTAAIDPSAFELAHAHTLRRTTLAVEHAALLDETFPDRFQQATEQLRTSLPA